MPQRYFCEIVQLSDKTNLVYDEHLPNSEDKKKYRVERCVA